MFSKYSLTIFEQSVKDEERNIWGVTSVEMTIFGLFDTDMEESPIFFHFHTIFPTGFAHLFAWIWWWISNIRNKITVLVKNTSAKTSLSG